jgi:hypothetical protein
MDPKHPLTPVRQDTNDTLTRLDLEAIANPMSVIFGYTQLLQRRVRRGQAVGDEELLRVLGLMDQALRTMIGELTHLSRQAGTNGDDPEQDQ